MIRAERVRTKMKVELSLFFLAFMIFFPAANLIPTAFKKKEIQMFLFKTEESIDYF